MINEFVPLAPSSKPRLWDLRIELLHDEVTSSTLTTVPGPQPADIPDSTHYLYVLLHVNPGHQAGDTNPAAYHWALQVGPASDLSTDLGRLLHAKITAGNWVYEDRSAPLRATVRQLLRIRVGKVADVDQLRQVTRSVEIINGNTDWNCVSWVREAFTKLEAASGIFVEKVLDFDTIFDAALQYMASKGELNRFKQKKTHGMAPTWDVVHGVEVKD